VKPGSAAYPASKAGLIALTKVSATEGARHGVTANVVAPGITDTPMTRGAIGRDEELLATSRSSAISNPMGVVLSPAGIASAVAWFCLPEAGRVTWQVLHVSPPDAMPPGLPVPPRCLYAEPGICDVQEPDLRKRMAGRPDRCLHPHGRGPAPRAVAVGPGHSGSTAAGLAS
jgi:hypothetical protein